MHLINWLAVLTVLTTNGVLGYLPKLMGDFGIHNNYNADLSLPANGNDDNFPIQDTIPYEDSDRSVYDPGVGKLLLSIYHYISYMEHIQSLSFLFPVMSFSMYVYRLC